MQASLTLIEVNRSIGARSESVEGVIAEEGSVISMGAFIGKSTKVYGCTTGQILQSRVPAGSVVVRQPAGQGRHAQPVLCGDRQARRCTDARQDFNQWFVARCELNALA